MYPTDYDEPRSLDPALSHEIIEFSRLIQTSLAKDIPTTFRDALSGLHDSTSTAFASSKRLQALAEDRFNRLIPARADLSSSPANEAGDIRYSEPAYFTYLNQLRAEKRYLLEEALPDWRHRAARAFQEYRQCNKKAVFYGTVFSQSDFETWFAELQEEIRKWLEEAEDTEIPRFEDTVAEYRALQAKEIKKGLAREERRSRSIMFELDMPEPRSCERAETVDSAVEVAFTSEAEDEIGTG